MELVEKVTLPVSITNRNDGTGHSWHRTHVSKKKYLHDLAAQGFKRAEPYPFPVWVMVFRVLGPRERLWDYSSGLRGSYKELEDALTDLGWWVDDGPKHIRACDFRQDATQRENGPAVRLEIYRAPGSP